MALRAAFTLLLLGHVGFGGIRYIAVAEEDKKPWYHDIEMQEGTGNGDQL